MVKLNPIKRIASIDLGVDNLITITTNCGVVPFIINGRPLKPINQYYNKKICDICTSLDQEEEYGMWEAKE